jgi:hypothetical protein
MPTELPNGQIEQERAMKRKLDPLYLLPDYNGVVAIENR